MLFSAKKKEKKVSNRQNFYITIEINIKNLGVLVEFILLEIIILLLVVKVNKPNPQYGRKFEFVRFDH